MAKIRAYKIAEELGIDRGELVDKAKAVGVELRSPMASLEEKEADALREKLGGHVPGAQVVERRVERKGGAAVIRRRKRVVPKPQPEPTAPEPLEPVLPALEEAAPEVVPPAAAEAEPAPTAEVVAEAPMPEPAPEPLAEPAPAEPQEPQPVAAEAPQPLEPIERQVAAPADEVAPAGPAPATAPPGKGKQRKRVKEIVNLREQEQLARQVTSRTLRRSVTLDPNAMPSPRRRRRDRPQPKTAGTAAPKASKRVLRVEGTITVADLAQQLGAKAAEVQGRLMALGTMATVNQALDIEMATKLADQYGFEVTNVGFDEAAILGEVGEEVARASGVPRPPVVTVMGHVDHGKTSLLDAIRKTHVVEGEAGGITQHIGAYQVTRGEQRITFIDTPGHEAFTTMRARGAGVTDIVILVVAASEGIMPQTVEAIEHAKAAGVPIIVAVNKCDLPDANPRMCRQRLMEHGLVSEEFGGETICVDVSALKGSGIDQLLEMVALQAELLELKADPEARARGVVLESQLDKGRGPVATVLIQEGTLRTGDAVVVGTAHGRVRAMQNERGDRLTEAPPSSPVQIIGLSAVPDAGQVLHAVENERAAREVVEHREVQEREQSAQTKPKLSLDDLFAQAEGEGPKELNVVLKADVHGSVEAVREALLKLSTDEVTVNVILAGVGGISESDVMLARASEAIVVGFHVRPDSAARRAAEGQGVDIRTYQIIYELTDEVRRAMAGLLPPKLEERVLGRVEVRKTFSVPRVGTIAGCYVTEGLIRRNARARLIRDGVQVWDGGLGSLKRFKDDTREVQYGFECGVGLEGFNDIKVGDVIEPYEIEETPASLS